MICRLCSDVILISLYRSRVHSYDSVKGVDLFAVASASQVSSCSDHGAPSTRNRRQKGIGTGNNGEQIVGQFGKIAIAFERLQVLIN